MTDQLLQAIEERLAERRRASLGTMTDERREKALRSLVMRARNNDGDGKERLEQLLGLFPQLGEWVAEQMAANKLRVDAQFGEAETPKPQQEQAGSNVTAPWEGIREITRRQVREAGETLACDTRSAKTRMV
jgi:hypothetical protein